MNPFLFVLVLVLSVAFCSKHMKENDKSIEFDEDKLVFYDSDDSDFEVKIVAKSVPVANVPDSRRDDDSPVPPPPGSNLMKTRKRTKSIFYTEEEVDLFGANALLNGSEEDLDAMRESRIQSDATVEEEWDGFIMCQGDLYGDTRHNSAESLGGTRYPVKQVKAPFSKSRSHSFTKKDKFITRLSSHSEIEECLHELLS